jgi:Rad3-related DNA helicase
MSALPSDYSLPFPGWRPFQLEALTALESAARESGVLFLDAPTSFGKSAVAVGLINRSGGSGIVLTGTKQLAAQYCRDFGDACEIRGRANYPCALDGRRNAANGPCTESGQPLSGACACSCEYLAARSRAARSRLVVTNMDYFLCAANHASALVPRQWAVVDEAHLLEGALMDFASVQWKEKELGELGLGLPDLDLSDTPAWQSWAKGLELQLVLTLRQAEDEARSGYPDAGDDLVRLRRLLANLRSFSRSAPERWIVERGPEGVVARPVWARDHFGPYLRRHAKKLLLMSATMISIGSVAGWLGVEEPFAELHFGSNIPVENRPFYATPAFRLGRGPLDPQVVVSWVDGLLEAYYPVPALIHTVNYPLRDLLLNRSRFARAMISHSVHDREAACRRYMKTPGFVVLVSPSLHQGADFPRKQGLQVLLKVPFPDLGDRLVAARKRQDPAWYGWATASAICQAYGRGSRLPDHLCDTWCLDANLRWFYAQHRGLFPPWFRAAVMAVEPDRALRFARQRAAYLLQRRKSAA